MASMIWATDARRLDAERLHTGCATRFMWSLSCWCVVLSFMHTKSVYTVGRNSFVSVSEICCRRSASCPYPHTPATQNTAGVSGRTASIHCCCGRKAWSCDTPLATEMSVGFRFKWDTDDIDSPGVSVNSWAGICPMRLVHRHERHCVF